MHGPAIIGWLLAALCAAAGALCLPRTRRGPRYEREAAAGEAAMGLGMAAMAVPATVLHPLPAPAAALLFTALAVASLALLRHGAGRHRTAHGLHHALGSLAMVHLAGTGGHGGSGGHEHAGAGPAAVGGWPLPAALLLMYFTAHVLHTGRRLMPAAAPGPAPGGPPAVRRPAPRALPEDAPSGELLRLPELAAACRLAMSMAMLAMLAPL